MEMKIIKRDGSIVDYNPEKIRIAIKKANNEVSRKEKATETEIEEIITYIEDLKKSRILVEDIQDIIEQKLMSLEKYQLAKTYITYRYTRALVRKANTTDQSIKELIEGTDVELLEFHMLTNLTETEVSNKKDYLIICYI